MMLKTNVSSFKSSENKKRTNKIRMPFVMKRCKYEEREEEI